MVRTLSAVLAATLLATLPAAAADKFTIKPAQTPAPKELSPDVQKALGQGSVQLLDDKGAVLAELWFAKELVGKATPEQVKNGLTYREIPEATFFGVMQVTEQFGDYRKQKIKPGVYTMRLGFQPMDGDHMGTAPHNEFLLLIPAADDKDPKPLGGAKELQEHSAKTTGGGHPAVFLLFPNKTPGDPKLVSKGDNHWALQYKQDVTVNGQKAVLGVTLTLIGFSPAA
jgi:hypothetical protein